MADIKELLAAYFAWPEDVDKNQPGEMPPDYSKGNQVDFLVDGEEYFKALRDEIEILKTGSTKHRYFFFNTLHFGLVKGPQTNPTWTGSATGSAYQGAIEYVKNLVPFNLGDAKFSSNLIDEMEKMVELGVDLRSLVWVSPVSFSGKQAQKEAGSFWEFNLHSLMSLKELRERPHLKAKDRYKKLIVNTLAHTMGAMHMKMIICGDDNGRRAYLAGLDFVSNRIANWEHLGHQTWHDVGVRVQGPATNALYNWFKLLWTEQIGRSVEKFHVDGSDIPSHFEDTPPFDKETPPAPALSQPGTHHVQVLRTSPQMHFDFTWTDAAPTKKDGPIPPLSPLVAEVTGCIARLLSGFRKDKLSFAKDGIFEFRLALRKAISHAQNYIYVEDQGFQSKDLMQWLKDRLDQNPALKIIMVHGADPSDPPNAFLPEWIKNLMQAKGAAQQVVFYECPGLIVHSKLTIIDDQWAAVGSANFYNRSLYTDGECSISVIDEPGKPTFAQRLRAYLWGEHCGLDPSKREKLLDLKASIGIWNKAWGTSPVDVMLSSKLERMELPFTLCDLAPGTVETTNGSDLIVGTDTNWTAALESKLMRVKNDKQEDVYRIKKVESPTAMRVVLRRDGKSPYQGTTGAGKSYMLPQPGKFMLDAFPAFDPIFYARYDADSRQEY